MAAGLVYVHPNDLQDTWPLVLPGLEKVKKHSASKWIAEDIYHALKAGYSTLHLAYVDQELIGFVILTLTQVFDGKVLHIWCAYSSHKHSVLSIFIPELETMARNIGAKRLTFWSPRNWEKIISRHGFVPAQVEFVKELV